MMLRLAVCLILASTITLQGCPVLVFGAAVGGTAFMTTERRTSDALLADERIEWTSVQRLRESGRWEQMNLNVTSYNRIALLTGQAANEDARQLAEKVVSEIPGVRGVSNELVVGAFSNFGARSGDSFVTTQVKARMVSGTGVNPTHVKVVTESGIVYLLGLVTQAESDAAAKIAAGTQGVNKVVKYFEYIADPAVEGAPKS
jgi:osmotically-inducible protein OsmY